MTNRYDQTSIYGITNPEPIIYGDGWIYGAVIPTQKVAIPKNVYVLHERDYNIISWENSSDDDMSAYIIYKSKTYGHADAYIIAKVDSKDTNGKTQTCYIDYLTDTELDTQYYYAVAAVNNVGLPSFKSEWNADINQDISFSQYAYLYTDGATQTYWNTLDLYKQLGNFDTDRNIVPFRDLGVNYTEKNGNRIEVKKDCNYLYATLLNLTDEQKENFSNLEYTLFMDDAKIVYNNSEVSNKPSITTSVYAYESDKFKLLNNLTINKIDFINYFMEDNEYYEDSKIFKYVSKIENSDNTLRVLNINRETFFNKLLEVNNQDLPLANNGNPNIIFTYTGEGWDLNIPVNNVRLSNVNLKDYGITYSTYSTPDTGTMIEISEYWELDNPSESESKYINSIYDPGTNAISLKDSNLKSYGIQYKYNILRNDVSFVVDFSKKVFVYFRVPYIYNSKILQTYIKETGVTGNILNKINFKAYNYLIFPNTIGKIFNQKDIKLRQMKGNLYKTDVDNDNIYKNFGSYFDFRQPSWMGEKNYRDCVLGSETTAGLLTAGMNGGTLEGIRQAVNSYSQGMAQLTDQSNTKYLTVYSSTEYAQNLPTVELYSPSASFTQNNIVCVTTYVVNTINNFTLAVVNTIPSDTEVILLGNGQQTEQLINIEEGYTALSGALVEAPYILTDCEFSDNINIDHNVEANYYMYVTDDLSSSQAITISDDVDGPSNPNVDDYWFNTNSTESSSYEYRTLYKYNGSSWEEYTSNLICNYDSNNYYYIANTTNTVVKGLYQIVEIEEEYFINVNQFFKNKRYSIDNSNDSRKSIVQLIGNNWVTIGYDVIESDKENWIFLKDYNNYTWKSNKEYNVDDITIYDNSIYKCLHDHVSSTFTEDLDSNYWDFIGFTAFSYTHNYLINTLNLKYTTWIKNVPLTKYVVYGNTIKVNDVDVIDNLNFIVQDYLTGEEFIRGIDYTVKNDHVIWKNFDRKPEDGSYVLISYDVDTRPETIRIVNLIKYPQIHINYIWE